MKKLASILFLLIFQQSIAQTTLILQPDAAAGKEADVVSNYPTTNYGTADQINPRAWTANSVANTLRSFIEFNLSSLPANAVISSAKLNLYFNTTASATYQNSGTNALWIQRVTSTWNESIVTWATQPTVSSTNRVGVAASTSATQNYTNIDVTQLLKDIVANSSNSYGFMLSLQTETIYKSVMMSSSDHANSALHPKLEITYTVPTNPTACISLQPNAAAGKDADVVSNAPTVNYGTSNQVNPRAWTASNVSNTLRSFIEFDFSTLPADAVITTSKLNLYFNTTASTLYQNSGTNPLWIQRVTSPWDEATVTWNNQPMVTTKNRVSVLESTTTNQDYTNLDVTALVKDILANPSSSHGFMLSLQTETVYKSVMMSSSDHANAALHPKLEVCYTSSIATGIIPQSNNQITSNVYPNPFATTTTIELTDNAGLGDVVISIYDLTGTQVQNKTITLSSNNSFNLDRGNLKEGFYLYVIKSGSQVVSTGKLNVLN